MSKLKIKGAYWTPDEGETYALSISESSPPKWHADLSNIVSKRAAVHAMTTGGDPETYIRAHADPFDFMLRARCDRSSRLMLGEHRVQSTFRYYVAVDGAPLSKVSPPLGVEGAWKRANGVTEAEYARVMAETGGAWDERVHTKNRSQYVTRTTGIETGFLVADCCDASWFRWENVNFGWYVAEARKLIIS